MLLLAAGAWPGDGAATSVPPPSGCPTGWDQLLPASERAQARAARGCAAPPAAAAGVLAGQMAMYGDPVTRGPLGPLAAADAPRAGSKAPPSRTAPRLPATARMGGEGRPAQMAPLIDRAARTHDIDPLLLHAIARIESRHRSNAVSHAGAHGLMQVIVPTAQRFGVGAARELHDPQTNLDVSARYLKTLQHRFGNDLPLVLAAYNAGEGAVEKHGRRIPPYRETQDYVRKVLAEYGLLRRVSQRQPAPVHARAGGEGML